MDLSSTLTNYNIETDEIVNESSFNGIPQSNLLSSLSSSSSESSSPSLTYQSQLNLIDAKRTFSIASRNNNNNNNKIETTAPKSKSFKLKSKEVRADEVYYNLYDRDTFEHRPVIDQHLNRIDGKNFERIYGDQRHDVTYERVNFVWFELAVPATLLLFSICGCICLIVLFVIWTNSIRNNAKKCHRKSNESILPFNDTKINKKHFSRIAITIDKQKKKLVSTITSSSPLSDDTLKLIKPQKDSCSRNSVNTRYYCKHTNEQQSTIRNNNNNINSNKYKEKRENIVLARMDSHETNSKLSNLNDSTEQLVSEHPNDIIVVKHSSANLSECRGNEFSVQRK